MSDLKLLSPDQPTPLERMLLNAAANESPSDEQRLRVRQALGLPALVAAPPLPRVNRRALAIKGVVAGAIVVSALVLQFRPGHGTSAVQKPDSTAVVAPPPAPPVPAPGAALANTPPEPVAQPLPPLETAPAPVSARRGLRTSAKASASSALSSSDLSEQLRLIEAARAAVAARNPNAAAQALASYSSEFPRGAFGQEAAVLRIQTLDLQNNHAQAAALARSFLARHPNSPHVSVVERIAGSSR